MVKSFDQYMAEAKSSVAASRPRAQRPAPMPKFIKAAQSTQAKEGTGDALSTFVDILTRPLSGVTNAFSDNVDRTVKRVAKGDLGGALSSVLLEGSISTPASFLEGMFSNDPNKHRSTGDVIEQTTDKIGPVLSRKYEDVEDNVDPVVKGAFGLAGDIAADPLTWIPGTQIAKIASLGAKGVKAGAAGLKSTAAITRAAEVAEKALPRAAKAKAKIETPSLESAVAAKADTGTDASTAPTSKGAQRQALDLEDEALAAASSSANEAARTIVKQAGQTPKGKAMAEIVDAMKPGQISIRVTPKALTVAEAKPLSFAVGASMEKGTKLDSGRDLASTSAWLGQARTLLSDPEVSVKFPGMGKAVEAAIGGNKQAETRLVQYYENNYLPKFREAKAQGVHVNALGRPADLPTPKETFEVEEVDARGAFRSLMGDNEDRVRAALGSPLIDSLRGIVDETDFQTTAMRMRSILDEGLDYDELRQLKPIDRQMLGQLGISEEALPPSIKPLQATASEEVVGAVDEVVAKVTAEEIPAVVTSVEKALRLVVKDDLLEPHLPGGKYRHRTKTGVYKTDEAYGVGHARIQRQANNYYQGNIFKAVIGDVSAEATKRGLFGMAAAQFKMKEVLYRLRLAERVLDTKGVQLVMGVGKDVLPLGSSQALDILSTTDSAVMARAFWNPGTAVLPTNLMDAVHAAVKDAPVEAIEAAIRNTKPRNLRADGRAVESFDNNIIKGGAGSKLGRELIDPDANVASLVALIQRAAPALRRVVQSNADAAGARQIDEMYSMSDEVLSELEGLYAEPGSFGALARGIDDVSSRVREIAAGRGAMQSSTDLTAATAKALIPATDAVVASSAMKTSTALKQIDASMEALDQEAIRLSIRETEDLRAALNSADDSRDLGEKIEKMANASIFGKTLGMVSNMHTMKKVYPLWRQSEGAFHTVVGGFNRALAKWAKSYPKTEDLVLDLRNARNGVLNTPGQRQAGHLWGQMFGLSDDGGDLLSNRFFNNGNGIDEINTLFARVPSLKNFMLDADAARALSKTEGISVKEALVRQAATWDLNDPVDQLSSLYHTFATLQTRQSLSDSFVVMARDLGAVSNVAKPGFKRVGNTGGSIFARHLPNDLYFDDEILRMMHVTDNITQETMELSGPVGLFVKEVYQPFQQAWKLGSTILHPTHHIRNGVGDGSLQGLALGTKGFVASFSDAARAMASRNNYDGMDTIKFMQGMNVLPDTGKPMATGRLGQITPSAVYAAMHQRGNLPSFVQTEHIAEDAGTLGSGVAARTLAAAQRTKPVQIAGGVSEARDHFFRLSHASQFIRQNINNPKFKSLDEMLDAASESTRKWHPDGLDMTKAERYFRLIIPFYSWQRKAIPLIVESVLRQPGRVMVMPKAQYNLAVAQGINPDSISDPFPDDQEFPTYMTEQITGPAFEVDGRYYGINPGFVANDVLNDWVGANPGRSAMSSVSPLLRMPFELASGAQVGTGAKINDYSDYIDSQIPLVSHASRFTGNSVTGTLFGGQGLDPQYQIAQGNKDAGQSTGMAFMNWLTGAGVTPMSQPNQINYAEIEARNAASGKGGGF